jgi:predicted MFS family arabinose efflux permease
MCVSGLIVGLASNYFIYIAGRTLIGVVIGGFGSMSAAAAMRLVPATSVPKALAIFTSRSALVIIVFKNRQVGVGDK